MTQAVSKTPTILTGVAGEYFVAAELSRRGLIASISLHNTRGIDVLVTNQAATRSVTIQCKTSRKKGKSWILSKSGETFFNSNHYYVFVSLGDVSERSNYHVVPSEDVADRVRQSHQLWLETPGKKGQQHVDGPIRTFSDHEDEFLERWDLLGL